MQAYSKEMRRDVLAACDAGEGTRAVALRFRVSESWVRRVQQERRELGKTAPATTRRRTPKWHAYRAQIEQIVAARPDLTLQELKDGREKVTVTKYGTSVHTETASACLGAITRLPAPPISPVFGDCHLFSPAFEFSFKQPPGLSIILLDYTRKDSLLCLRLGQ